ncbi:radial spoke protein 9 [Monoraphidium neglectum]|uniref:Radial spoke head protein 9 homolog n=1 Tax=Monoraphidium neglectum TaxID=145388 RepID=A0A0D2M6K0_9CHLO|nr:radial spoke protein 9 [Monoraphidium neglectum]KIY96856.1 radial spoke protein 9 [Monoraphidium neglectum]|eukprot:XP_013895876.1 radial spoke protein 9 [Monoraphidium neglectum]
MVQTEPNLLLTLKHVARCGAVLSCEAVAALDHSLPIKRAEAGVRSLNVWGRITTRSGKDYLIAEGGCDTARVYGTQVTFEPKIFFSQDGIKWADLPRLEPEAAARAVRIRTMLTGDPAFQHNAAEADPAAAADDAGGGEGAAGPRVAVTEAQRLRGMVDAINELAAVQPVGCCVANAHNQLVTNKLFSGLEHPGKLESFQHRRALQPDASLAQDVRGGWSVAADAFKGVTLLRSLLYPGYFFYYDNRGLTWGGFYSGDGLRNNDLAFML